MVIRHVQNGLTVGGERRPILCWRDAFVTIARRRLRRAGERNRKWQKQNPGGGVVTRRRLAATEIVKGGLDFNGFSHFRSISSKPRALCSFGRSVPIQSDHYNSQI